MNHIAIIFDTDLKDVLDYNLSSCNNVEIKFEDFLNLETYENDKNTLFVYKVYQE